MKKQLLAYSVALILAFSAMGCLPLIIGLGIGGGAAAGSYTVNHFLGSSHQSTAKAIPSK